MDATEAKEALFNEVYDTEHLPLQMRVPGVCAAQKARWPGEVRPFTSNRRHIVRKVL